MNQPHNGFILPLIGILNRHYFDIKFIFKHSKKGTDLFIKCYNQSGPDSVPGTNASFLIYFLT